MIKRFRRSWHGFSDGRTGRRFRDRYHRRRRSGKKTRLTTILALTGGLALMLAGLVMVVAPGPGWITFFLGLGVVSGEFLPAARLMDRGEVKARKLIRKAAKLWRRSPAAAWSVTASVALTFVLLLGYGGYVFFYEI